jgi:FKBP-type peptidyl-prolyl cis-trans isomerase
MFKQLAYLFLFTALIVGVMSCGGKQKTDFGIQYEVHTKGSGKKIQEGDVITLQFNLYGKSKGKDTLLQSSYGSPQPFEVPYQAARKDWFSQSLGLVTEGDSLSLYVPLDSILRGAPKPDFIDAKTDGRFTLKVAKVISADEHNKVMQKRMEEMQQQQVAMQAEMEKQMEIQKPIDEEIIKKYIADNKLKVTRTEAGLYYVITSAGSGDSPQTGQMVDVHYKGSLLNGDVFDSSEGKPPLAFAYNTGGTIKGFDAGVGMLKKGGKATLIIPSHLAYGTQGAGDKIKPFSILRFDIELVDIKPAQTPTNSQ